MALLDENAGDGAVLTYECVGGRYPSVAARHPPAIRLERAIASLSGLEAAGAPDLRPWLDLGFWDVQHPLGAQKPARKPEPYAFLPAEGEGLHQIPVGPVHAGIIEPGHFRFHALGEQVLRLEERLGYVHKGIEKIAVGRDPAGLARLAGRVSGDCTVAHTWAACMAMERAAGISVPPRGLAIRAMLAERERIANHLGDIGAICNDVGFSFAQMQFSRLREDWQRGSQAVFGHRLLMDCIVPGGVVRNLADPYTKRLLSQCDRLSRELDTLLPVLEDHPSLEDRLEETGTLPAETARELGVLGYVAKASGQDYDLRRDHGHAPYDELSVQSPCRQEGDVAARLQIRAEEIRISLELLRALLKQLPDGSASTTWPASTADAEGLGLIEGWRGEILSYVRFAADGRVARFFPRDPSWFNWLALEQLIHGNIVPDFPVCNKSVNGSYSGHDL
jgi:Ni,Fe-hydrogenase III large subunit